MISVIVPVYNREKAIRRCIESILNQTYKDIEIILVNDGSTDASGDICKSYTDNRIRYIEKSNGGVSSARNAGIDAATGEFIQFVDSDDYLEADMCENLIFAIGHFDVAICGYKIVKITETCDMLPGDFSGSIKGIDSLIPNLFSDWFINSPWNKLYRKSLINNKFDCNYSLGEDLLFNLKYFSAVSTFTTVNKPVYNYDMTGSDTLTKCKNKEYVKCIKDIYSASMNFYNNFCKNSSTKRDIVNIYVDNFISLIKANLQDEKFIRSLIYDDITQHAFSEYIPPSYMQYIFKNLVLNKKVKSIIFYIHIRELFK